MWRWLLVGTVVVALGGAGVVWRGRQAQDAQQQDTEDSLVAVTQTDLLVKITATGVVQPIRTVNLSPKTSGQLTAVLVDQGDRVQAGQVVARMDNRNLQAQLIQAEGNLAQAQARLAELKAGTRREEVDRTRAQVVQNQAQISEAQARLSLANDRFQRNQALYAQGAIALDALEASKTDVDQAQANLEQAQAQAVSTQRQLDELLAGSRPETLDQAQAQVMAAEGQVAAIQVQLEDTIIRAPFGGIITQRYADPGAFVTPTTSASATASATSTSIVALAQGLEVLANVPEVDLSRLSLNQPVQIVADSFPERTFQGKVKRIAPEAVKEQNVTSFQVEISLETGLEDLRSGMNVDTTFLGAPLIGAVVVPTAAIVTLEGQPGLLVPDSEKQPQFQPVTLGISLGNQTQILEGLTPGDRVFLDLPPGFDFKDIKAPPSP